MMHVQYTITVSGLLGGDYDGLIFGTCTVPSAFFVKVRNEAICKYDHERGYPLLGMRGRRL